MSAESESPAPLLAASAGRAPAQGQSAPVSRRWTASFGLVWLGYWMANLVPLQLLLPQQLASID